MTIAELRKRSNNFVSNLDVHIAAVVEHNEQLIKLNREQLKNSRTSEGGPLINQFTGSPRYSPRYAKFKGYDRPDLILTGSFHREMDIIFNEPDQYFLTSFDEKTAELVDMYTEEIFGIQDKATAKAITSQALGKRYKAIVLR